MTPSAHPGAPDPTRAGLAGPSTPNKPSVALEEAETILNGMAAVFFQNKALAAEQRAADRDPVDSRVDNETRYRALVEQIPAVVFMASIDKGIGDAYVSPQIEASLGFSQSEWLQDPVRWYQRIHPDDKSRWSTDAAQMFLSGNPLKSCYRVIARDGRVVWFQCEAKMVRNEDGQPWFIHGVGFDITELKETEHALHEQHKQLQLLEDIASKANEAKNIAEAMQFAIERICEFTGWLLGHVCFVSEDGQELLSSNIWNLTPKDSFLAFRESSAQPVSTNAAGLTGRAFSTARPAWIKDVTADPSCARQSTASQVGIKSAFAFPVLSGINVVAVMEFFSSAFCPPPSDALVKLIANVGTQLGQVVNRVRSQEKLLHDAFHDSLTTLPNRALFLDRLERAVARAKRHGDYKFAVLFIDIDRFKIVNDSLGHDAGDDLIIQVSQRVLGSLRLDDLVARPVATTPEWNTKDDTLARLGGDEFTVLLDDIRDPADGIRVAQRIQNIFSEPFVISGQDVFCTASIGIVSGAGHGSAADVLRNADTAMYRAKIHGKARCEIFGEDMHEQSVNRLKLETDLRRALERQEFRVYYQPIITLRTGEISGFEALLRWERPGQGFVSPLEFIGVAEEMGLIVLIGMWVLKTACKQAHQWHLEHPLDVPLTMSINISARQFLQDDLVAQVERILRETEVEPSAIKLEITESVTMGDAERTIQIVQGLKKLGLRISIDDFGTGYSSLSYLRRFPMDTLKIDRSFVSDLKKNPENREIISTIIGLARNLGMNVVAEGAETLEEISYLKTLDCEFAQGYYYSKPVDSLGAQALLQAKRTNGDRQAIAAGGTQQVTESGVTSGDRPE
jgi:PAS domain S-box-containing protein